MLYKPHPFQLADQHGYRGTGPMCELGDLMHGNFAALKQDRQHIAVRRHNAVQTGRRKFLRQPLVRHAVNTTDQTDG